MESPIERPLKGQKSFYSGKQGEHILKTQVILDERPCGAGMGGVCAKVYLHKTQD